MKRKQPHKECHLHEKESKILQNEIATTKFNDLCEDVTEMVLCHLELKDLINVADTNKRLQNIARSIFYRKFRHHLICIETPSRRTDDIAYADSLPEKIKQFVRIRDAKVWFKLIRIFGESIKNIKIDSDYIFPCDYLGNIPNVFKYLIVYVLKYCADSLELLELSNCPCQLLQLNKPLTKLNEFIGQSQVLYEEIEYMPNLRCLSLKIIPKTLEKNSFSNLAVFETRINNSENVHSFISVLHMNQQIRKLKLDLHFGDCNDLIFSTINELLPELESLTIVNNYSSKKDVQAAVPNYRFKKIKSLTFGALPCEELYSSFMFNDVEELSFTHLEEGNVTGMNLARNMKKLKKLTFTFACNCIEYHKMLLNEFPELELLIVRSSNIKESEILTKILATKWKRTQMKERHLKRKYFKLTFQRISDCEA